MIFGRRVRVLAKQLAPLLPQGARVLDVGCGDGLIDKLILEQRPDVTIVGVDVHPRALPHVPVQIFDGKHLPFADDSFDVVMFIDVLHHADDPFGLLKEAKRVSPGHLILKDHLCESAWDRKILTFMDAVGNQRFGVRLPGNYWSESRWRETFQTLRSEIEVWQNRVLLYPAWLNWLFGRGLHFTTRLRSNRSEA